MTEAICGYTICNLNINLIELFCWSIELLILHSFYRRIEKETPDHYLSLIEIRSSSETIPFYLKYVGFRFVPIFFLCLLNNKILSNLSESSYINILVFNIVLVSTELLTTNLRAVKNYWGYNLAYGHLSISIILLTTPILTHYLYPLIYKLLPSTQGVIDSVWSALIIFSLYSVIIFLNKKGQQQKPYPTSQDLLKTISKNSDFIEKQCRIYNANPDLIKAVAIYESTQRPKFLRALETIFVLLFKVPVSQGIMQFTIDRVISDEESIILAIEKYFKNTDINQEDYEIFRASLSLYNPSSTYIHEIQRVYWQISGKGFK